MSYCKYRDGYCLVIVPRLLSPICSQHNGMHVGMYNTHTTCTMYMYAFMKAVPTEIKHDVVEQGSIIMINLRVQSVTDSRSA